MSRRSLALFAAAVVLPLGVAWFALHDPTSTIWIGDPIAQPQPTAEFVDVAELAAPSAPVAAESRSPRTSAPIEPSWDVPADALWVEGRIEFPPDTPRDEHAFVVAYGLKYGDSSQHRFEVGADGRFRAAFAAGTKPPIVGLEARYLYLEERVQAGADTVAAGLVLRPRLGACLRLTVEPTRLAAARGVDWSRAKLTVDGGPNGARPQSLSGTFDARGFAEIGGLAPAPAEEWELAIRLPGFHCRRFEPIESTAGATIERRVELVASPRLTGLVRDARGEAVSEARILLEYAGGLVVNTDEPAQSDGAGRFEIFSRNLKPVSVRGEKEGLLAGRAGPFDLDEGAERADIELVLAQGLAIQGVVLWPDGRAAVGATVELANGAGVANWNFRQQSTRAGEDGSFTFGGLTDQPHRLLARASEALVGEWQGASSESEWFGFNDNVSGGARDVVLVLSASFMLRGRVVDDVGEPSAGFEIVADCSNLRQVGLGEKAASSRGASGRFELKSVSEGAWTIRARARPGYSSTPVPVQLPRDAKRELLLVLARPAAIEGRVSDVDGSAAVGATVRAAPSDAKAAGAWESATTDADGRFRIDAIAPVPLTVRAESQARAPSSAAEIAPKPGEVVSVEFTLQKGGTIVGHVLDLHDRPRAGETVGWDPGSPGSESRSTRTAADGSFRFEGVEPGRSSVWVREEAEAAGLSGSSVVTASESYGLLEADIVMEPGATVGVDLGGSPKGPIRVRGSVRAKHAIAGATIQFYPVDESGGDAGERRGAHSDTSGNYVLRLAGSGSYEVMADAPGLAAVNLRIEITSASEQVVDIEFGTSTIAGVVLGPDAKPAAGVRVSARKQDGEDSDHVMSVDEVATSGDGTFELGGLLPGSYKVRARQESYGFSTTATCSPVERSDIVLVAGQTRDGLELRLARGCAVLVRVVNAGGLPVARAQVMFDRFDDDVSGASTDSGGAVLLTNLKPGLLTLSARTKTDAEREPVQVVAALDRTAEATLTLGPGGRVALRLERSDGVEISQAMTYRIEFVDGSGQVCRDSLTDNRGGVLIYGPMRPGTYTVRARFGTKPAEARVDVVAGGESEVVLREP